MRVKKFQAETLPDAMRKVRSELGTDAVILNSKVRKTGGFLGLFKKNMTEVIAAIDPADEDENNGARKKAEKQRTSPLTNQNDDEIMKELKELRSLIQEREQKYPGMYQEAFEFLISQEISQEYAHTVIEKLLQHEKAISDYEELEQRISVQLSEQMKAGNFGDPVFDKKFIHLFGPTGVGKTTTLAKLAAEAVLNYQWKVGFITTDTYRMAAIDQLKTYANILDVPLEVAYSLEDYKKAKARYSDFDLVLVDTPGRNFRDASFVKELQQMVHFDQESDNFLVLALTSKYSDMKDIYAQFAEIPIHQLIFTKADETSSIGSAVNMTIQHQLGVAFMTDGQNVPDDIRTVSAMELAGRSVEGFAHERSS
ncbi:flagellar biosynthesis protein FlhF [Halobacillus karajensis]|uniref:flagellar biosynthesis protein FlhF n=1 Tax=Halobacillus karajensis TaxID=195088 RepID=UPI0008A7D141|nr:flagellar biosynthesis protein FlhF [Halobacillus karajensis]SEH73189.1 flagellar biosynthesis protein FlhF [Halobacillus karajensis]